MNRIRWYGPSIVLMLTIVAAMLLGPGIVKQIAFAQVEQGRVVRIANLEANSLLQELSQAYTDVARAVEPSVVHIEVLARRDAPMRGGDMPDELRRWFFGPGAPAPRPRDMQPRGDGESFDRYNPPTLAGNGAGWVYDADGHIITNNHVVENADEIRVRFFDGSKYDAEIVGIDPNTDVAVLKVDASDLHPAVIEPEPVRQGEIVFAFGSPFRFDFSMSQGIVSAKGRQLGIIGPGGYEKFIQTDAAINPGNSGGPLTNIEGKVVGMNTAIASRTGAYNGLGFAIPVSMVTRVADNLITEGKVRRGYLGVYIDDLSPRMAQTFGYDGEGVLVRDPIPGSPAAEAGLKPGDIVTEVNGREVGTADELRFFIASLLPGEEVELGVFREGEMLEIDVTLGELPDDRFASSTRVNPRLEDGAGDESLALQKLGIERVETFTRRLAEQTGWDAIEGVLVTNVRPGSIAANEGIRRGAVITQVMDESVSDLAELIDALDAIDAGKPIRFTIAEWSPRDESFVRRFIAVEVPVD